MDCIGFIIIGLLSRLAPHVPNMTSVGATALFSGAKLGAKKALAVLFVTMLVSDLILGLHPVMWATYGSLLITIGIGRMLGKRSTPIQTAGAILASSSVFFILTNFAVWALPGGMYAKTPAGLLACYVMALPFWRNSLLGDILYGTVFFGGYEFVRLLRVRRVTA